MVRRLIIALSAVCLVLFGVIAGQELERRDRSAPAAADGAAGDGGHGGHVAQDWSSLPPRDLTIAGLFLLARREGIGTALDSLESLVRTDSTIRGLGDSQLHHVVHTMGRFAIRENGNDPRIFVACRPSFRSGCFHGVMEGYFAAGAPDDSASLSALCTSLIADDAIARLRLECAHGMGHGLAARGAHDPSNALPKCDVLPTPRVRRSCYDGVFMEAVNYATSGLPAPSTSSTVSSAHDAQDSQGTQEAPPDSHAMHRPSAPDLPVDTALRTTNARPTYATVRSMCKGRDARHEAACWYYQPILFLADAKGDVADALEQCVAAPAAAQEACASGIGKQAMGYTSESRVASACRAASGVLASGCRAGLVQYHVDLRWTADAAAVFCRSLPQAERTECFTALGAAIAPIYPNADAAGRACDALAGALAPALAPACRSGVRRASME